MKVKSRENHVNMATSWTGGPRVSKGKVKGKQEKEKGGGKGKRGKEGKVKE